MKEKRIDAIEEGFERGINFESIKRLEKVRDVKMIEDALRRAKK